MSRKLCPAELSLDEDEGGVMVNSARFTGSEAQGSRRELRLERQRERRLVLRHRWYAGGLATLISAALIFTGVGTPALADTPTPTPTDTAAATPPADDTTPPADDTTPPADDTTPPADDATPPADEATPPPADGATDPTPTPSPTATDPVDPSAKSTLKTSTDALGDVGIEAVPPATGTNAVITVKVGSDRTGITGVTPLAGVTLVLNTGNAAGTAPSGTRPDGVSGTGAGWALCVSDVDGDCSFTVPNTQATPTVGVNRDKRFWVLQAGTSPAGYYSNPSLRTGGSSGAGTAMQYTFQTGTQLRAGTTYSSQNANDFMLSSGNSLLTASGGIWQQSRTNPALPASCGLDVALILDLSGSVQTAGALPALKQAADTFVNSLVGTQSRMSLFSFSTISPAVGATQNYPSLTSVSTTAQANAFKNRYAAWTATGNTNWDRGFGTAAAANSLGNNFDIAVVITDGNPTAYNDPSQGPGNTNRFRETENGIFSANALKHGPVGAPAPTRILAFGVGDGATGAATALNLRAISGGTAYNGSNGTGRRLLPDDRLPGSRWCASRSRARQLPGNADGDQADRPLRQHRFRHHRCHARRRRLGVQLHGQHRGGHPGERHQDHDRRRHGQRQLSAHLHSGHPVSIGRGGGDSAARLHARARSTGTAPSVRTSTPAPR